VHTGPGFGFSLVLLMVTSVANAIGWYRARPRAVPVTQTLEL